MFAVFVTNSCGFGFGFGFGFGACTGCDDGDNATIMYV
jgi:hypothetical protein